MSEKAGRMTPKPIFIELGDKAPAQNDKPSQPPPEDELGGGDICSLEDEPTTDDDKPLD